MGKSVRRILDACLWLIGGVDLGVRAGFATTRCVAWPPRRSASTSEFLVKQHRSNSGARERQPLWAEKDPKDDDDDTSTPNELAAVLSSVVLTSPGRTAAFSVLMAASGALLGPFLDSFHSAFGVLQYDAPLTATLWGPDPQHPALITAWWVPELFGLAGFLIGWLYILLDAVLLMSATTTTNNTTATTRIIERATNAVLPSPSPPTILLGISIFTFQYWLSGILYQSGVDRTTILNVMSVAAACGFWFLDRTYAGFLASAVTALGGPLIEVGLLTLSRSNAFHGAGYHYTDLGETGFFPLWIVPVYFLGGPANGNLARGYWTWLNHIMGIRETQDDSVSSTASSEAKEPPGCPVCNDTRRVPCPNW